MAKRMILMLVVVAALLGGLGFAKFRQVEAAIAQGTSYQPPPTAVTTVVAQKETWPSTQSLIGTLSFTAEQDEKRLNGAAEVAITAIDDGTRTRRRIAGDLHVRYGVGQHFITEVYQDQFGIANDYHASILSGSVPAAENDALTLDLKCTGHQVFADVRTSYYPQPNTVDMMRDELTTLGGRPAWVSKFRLHFHTVGLHATSELVGLALIDVGRPNAAIIYVSIPNTVSQYDRLVDEVLASVRPT